MKGNGQGDIYVLSEDSWMNCKRYMCVAVFLHVSLSHHLFPTMCVCARAHMSVSLCVVSVISLGDKRLSDLLELEFQVFVNCLPWSWEHSWSPLEEQLLTLYHSSILGNLFFSIFSKIRVSFSILKFTILEF